MEFKSAEEIRDMQVRNTEAENLRDEECIKAYLAMVGKQLENELVKNGRAERTFQVLGPELGGYYQMPKRILEKFGDMLYDLGYGIEIKYDAVVNNTQVARLHILLKPTKQPQKLCKRR